MKNYSRLLQKLLFCVYLPTTSLSVVNTRLHDVAFRVTLTSAGSVTISSPSLISYKNVLSHAFFFQCHDHTFAKIDWSPQTAQTASRGDVSVKPQRKCFTEKAFNHLPFFFFFLAVATANLTSAWMKEQQWRKMTCCAVWREMSFMGYNTANGVIISDHCVLFFPSHILLRCDEDLTLLFTYSSNNPLFFLLLHIHFDIPRYSRLRALRRQGYE